MKLRLYSSRLGASNYERRIAERIKKAADVILAASNDLELDAAEAFEQADDLLRDPRSDISGEKFGNIDETISTFQDRTERQRRSLRKLSGDGGIATFRSKRLRGVFTVHFRGMSVSGPRVDGKRGPGEVRMGFVLSPASAVCKRDGRAIFCTLKGDKSLPSLQGTGKKRRR